MAIETRSIYIIELNFAFKTKASNVKMFLILKIYLHIRYKNLALFNQIQSFSDSQYRIVSLADNFMIHKILQFTIIF